MTKPQKIEGGWRSRFDEKFSIDGMSTCDGEMMIGLGEEIIKDFISEEIEKAKASERQRCVDILEKVEQTGHGGGN